MCDRLPPARVAERQRVRPHGLLYGNRVFLVAMTDWSEEPRLWRLTNVSETRLADETFDRAPAFDLQRYARRSFGTFQEEPVEVVLRFDAAAARDASAFLFHPDQSVEENGDGSVTVRFTEGVSARLPGKRYATMNGIPWFPLAQDLTMGIYGPQTAFQKFIPFDDVVREMNNSANWVSPGGKFRYEHAIRDYAATFPNRLEDGLLPHPNMKVTEMTFQDGRRADVMLVDRYERTVIVECKQHSPSKIDIDQLRGYKKLYEDKYGETPRGILVHAGASKLSPDIEREALGDPVVEVVSYVLDVKFIRSVAIPSGLTP